jgi:hypothetical protein
MKKLACAFVILAAASTAAVAKDLKQDKKATAPAVAATQMNDTEMDKVTAGGGVVDVSNNGVTGLTAGGSGAGSGGVFGGVSLIPNQTGTFITHGGSGRP